MNSLNEKNNKNDHMNTLKKRLPKLLKTGNRITYFSKEGCHDFI